MILEGVNVYLTTDRQELLDMAEELTECRNCVQFSTTLFGYECAGIEDGEKFELSCDNSTCECFYARNKKVSYWVSKLYEMYREYSGINDHMRQFYFHEKNGTATEYLKKVNKDGHAIKR